MSKIKICRICKSKEIIKILDLGKQPLANHILNKVDEKAKTFPLDIFLCKKCYGLQLGYNVPPNKMFSDYSYATANTKPLCEHFKNMTKFLQKKFKLKKNDVVIDIGCNDGTLLSYYNKNIIKVGIDPSNVSKKSQNKFNLINKFFDHRIASVYLKKFKKAKIITATNVFAHVNEHKRFLKGVHDILDDNGVFIIEVPYVDDMIKSKNFDTIYHEHVFYFSVHSINFLLNKFNFEIFDIQRFTFGPSGPPLRFFCRKIREHRKNNKTLNKYLNREKKERINKIATYFKFKKDVENHKIKLKNILKEISKNNKIVGIGAPAKANTILNYLKISNKELECILETNKLKFNKFTPITKIQIKKETSNILRRYKYAFLLSWNIKDYFLKKTSFVKNHKGKVIIPFPEPKILG
tara:strand:- start:5321 stop:6544 length:1224 start_codon:yes stop_codon:yes gene_type:complete